jgi:hypothetical protein
MTVQEILVAFIKNGSPASGLTKGMYPAGFISIYVELDTLREATVSEYS